MAQQRIHSRLPAAEVLRGQSGGTVGRVGGNPSLTKLARRMISHASTCQLDCKLAAGLQLPGSQCSCSASGNSGTGKGLRGGAHLEDELRGAAAAQAQHRVAEAAPCSREARGGMVAATLQQLPSSTASMQQTFKRT